MIAQPTKQVGFEIDDARALAARLLDRDAPTSDVDSSQRVIAVLSTDVLPDWYDDDSILQAEVWHQRRKQALNALVDRLIASGRYSDATSAALAAMNAEPLSEASHAALMRVYIIQGKRAEALAVFERYRIMLDEELGLEPTHHLEEFTKDQNAPTVEPITATLSGG